MFNNSGKIILIMSMLLSIIGCSEPPVQADFTNLTVIERPNYYIVCPPEYCNIKPHEISPVYPFKLKNVLYHWEQVIKSEPRVTLIAEDRLNNQFTYVQRSKVFRFPDIINIKFIELGNGLTTLAVYSQSKYGYSDLGVNQQRVDLWLEKLTLDLSKHHNKPDHEK